MDKILKDNWGLMYACPSCQKVKDINGQFQNLNVFSPEDQNDFRSRMSSPSSDCAISHHYCLECARKTREEIRKIINKNKNAISS